MRKANGCSARERDRGVPRIGTVSLPREREAPDLDLVKMQEVRAVEFHPDKARDHARATWHDKRLAVRAAKWRVAGAAVDQCPTASVCRPPDRQIVAPRGLGSKAVEDPNLLYQAGPTKVHHPPRLQLPERMEAVIAGHRAVDRMRRIAGRRGRARPRAQRALVGKPA